MNTESTWREIGEIYGLTTAATKQLAWRRGLDKLSLIAFLEKKNGRKAPPAPSPSNYKDTARSVARRSDTEMLHRHHWSYREEHYADTIMMSVTDHHLLHTYITYDETTKMYRDYKGKLLTSKAAHIALLMYIKMV
jgi:hypothetical protein